MGEQQRIREARLFFQVATERQFVDAVEAIMSRTVHAFATAIDPDRGVVFEVFHFVPKSSDGASPAS
jgi:hypothetical protein